MDVACIPVTEQDDYSGLHLTPASIKLFAAAPIVPH